MREKKAGGQQERDVKRLSAYVSRREKIIFWYRDGNVGNLEVSPPALRSSALAGAQVTFVLMLLLHGCDVRARVVAA